MEQRLDLLGATFVFKPKKLRYSASVAQVRNFELSFASGSTTNRLKSENGVRFGLGIGGSFVPVTIASVGVGWSLDYRYFRASLDRFESDGIASGADETFQQDELQASTIATWRWKTIAPYGGLKVQRWITRLNDNATHESIRGTKDGVSPLVGLEWTPVPGEGGSIEASFIDERAVTASWMVKF
jgi:hypothetical protein